MSDPAHAAGLTIVLVLAFAALVTTHVAVVHGILATSGRRQAAMALVLLPFAPYAAFRDGLPLRAVAWLVFAVAYVVALILAW